MAFTRKNLAKIILCTGAFFGVWGLAGITNFTVTAQQTVMLLPCMNQADCQTKAASATDLVAKETYELLVEYYVSSEALNEVLDYFSVHGFSLKKDDKEMLASIQARYSVLSNQTIENMNQSVLSGVFVDQEKLAERLVPVKTVFEAYSQAFLDNDTDEMIKQLDLLVNYYEYTEFKSHYASADNDTAKNLELMAQQFKDLQLYVERAGESFDKLQRSPRKNMRQYRIVMEYVRTELLDAASFQQPENEALGIPAEELKRTHESILYDEIVSGITSKRKQADWSLSKEIELYKNLITYFEKPLDNPVEELREHTPNGDILPGTRLEGGTDFVMQNVLPGIINTILIVILSVSVLMLMAGGFMYVVSAGNAEATKKALDMIIWTIVGTIAAVLVFSAVKFIIGIDFTDNEDKMPAVTNVQTDKNGAIVERAFEHGGNPEAGAALALGAAALVEQGLNQLGNDSADTDGTNPTDAGRAPPTQISITEVAVALPNRTVQINDSLLIDNPLTTRSLADLSVLVQTNIGTEATVVDWQIRQEKNGVIFRPDTTQARQAIFSSLANLTGGDYTLQFKAQALSDPSNFVWSEPFGFTVSDSAMVTRLEYSYDQQNWFNISLNQLQTQTLNFSTEGYYLRIFVDSAWQEQAIINPKLLTSLVNDITLVPTILSYDEDLGRPFLYHVTIPQTQSFTFSAQVKNPTQTDTADISDVTWNIVVDRTLSIESVDYGTFTQPNHWPTLSPNTVCVKPSLGSQVQVDWQLGWTIGVINPDTEFPYDLQNGWCAQYRTLGAGTYNFQVVLTDIADSANTLTTSSLHFLVRPNITVTSTNREVAMNGVATVLPNNASVFLRPGNPYQTDTFQTYIQTNLQANVTTTWRLIDEQGQVISTGTPLAYDPVKGHGASWQLGQLYDNLTVQVTVQDADFPMNNLSLNVWTGRVIAEPLTINALSVFDPNTGINLPSGHNFVLLDPLGNRSIDPLKLQVSSNYGSYAQVSEVSMISLANGRVIYPSFSYQNGEVDIPAVNNLDAGDWLLRVRVEDTQNSQNNQSSNAFSFSITEPAVLLAAEYSVNNGATWQALVSGSSILPYDYRGGLFRFGIDSSLGSAGQIMTSFGTLSSQSTMPWVSGTGFRELFTMQSPPLDGVYTLNSTIFDANTADFFLLPPTDFDLKYDRSLYLVSEDYGVFESGFVSTNQSNQVCIDTNLGSDVSVTWELISPQQGAITPILTGNFLPGIGYCALYSALTPDDYTFSVTIMDQQDPTNTLHLSGVSFVVLPPLMVTESVLSHADAASTAFINDTVVVTDAGQGGWEVADGLRVTLDTNHPNHDVTVLSADIFDTNGTLIHSADVLQTAIGTVSADFLGPLALSYGMYDLDITVASNIDPANQTTLTVPFVASSFVLTNVETYHINQAFTSFNLQGNLVTSLENLPVFFDANNRAEFAIRIQMDANIGNDLVISNSQFLNTAGNPVSLFTNAAPPYTINSHDANWFIRHRKDYLSADFFYGEYTWRLELKNQAGDPTDVQVLEFPVSLVPPTPTQIHYLEYNAFNGANSVPFGSLLGLSYKTTADGTTTDTVLVTADPSSTGVDLSVSAQRGSYLSGWHSFADLSQLVPGVYNEIKIQTVDNQDSSITEEFLNHLDTEAPAANQLTFPFTVERPPLVVYKTDGSYFPPQVQNGEVFAPTDSIEIQDFFAPGGHQTTPFWIIRDAQGTVVADQSTVTTTTATSFWGDQIHTIPLASIPIGVSYELTFYTESPTFAGGAPVHYAGPLVFDVLNINQISYDDDKFGDDTMVDNLTNTVCIDSNLGDLAMATWNLQDSSNNVIAPTNIVAYDATNGWCVDYSSLTAGNYTFDVTVTDSAVSANTFTTSSVSFAVTEQIVLNSEYIAVQLSPTYHLNSSTNNNILPLVDGGIMYYVGGRFMFDLTLNVPSSDVSILSYNFYDQSGTAVSGLSAYSQVGSYLLLDWPIIMNPGDYTAEIVIQHNSNPLNQIIYTYDFTAVTFQITSVTKEFILNGTTHTIPADNKIYGQAGTINIGVQTDLADPADTKIYSAEFRPVGGTSVGTVITQDGANALAAIQLDASIPYGDYEFEIEVGDTNNPNYTETVIENITISPTLTITNIDKMFSNKDGYYAQPFPANNEITPFVIGQNGYFSGRVWFDVDSDLDVGSISNTKIYSATLTPVGGNTLSGLSVSATQPRVMKTFDPYQNQSNQLFYGDYELEMVVGDKNNPVNQTTVTEIFHVVPPATVSLLYLNHANANWGNTFSMDQYIQFQVKTSLFGQENMTVSLIPQNSANPTLTLPFSTPFSSSANYHGVMFQELLPGLYELEITTTSTVDPTITQTFNNPGPTFNTNWYFNFPIEVKAEYKPKNGMNWNAALYPDNHTFNSGSQFFIKSTLPNNYPNPAHVPMPQWEIKDSNGVVLMNESTHPLLIVDSSGTNYYKFDLSSLNTGTGYTLDFAESSPTYYNGHLIEFDGVYTFNIQ